MSVDRSSVDLYGVPTGIDVDQIVERYRQLEAEVEWLRPEVERLNAVNEKLWDELRISDPARWVVLARELLPKEES